MIKKILITALLIALLINSVNAQVVTAQVDDKGLIYDHNQGVAGTLHTPYGWIIVTDNIYNKVMVNDTIRYDTNKNTFWTNYWNVELIK